MAYYLSKETGLDPYQRQELGDLGVFWGKDLPRLEYLTHLVETGRVKVDSLSVQTNELRSADVASQTQDTVPARTQAEETKRLLEEQGWTCKANPNSARSIVHTISELQSDAWASWNASYHEPNPTNFRATAEALYRQDVREKVQSLFARSNEQNAKIDAALNPGPESARESFAVFERAGLVARS